MAIEHVARMRTKGGGEVQKKLTKLRREAPEAFARALWEESLDVFRESQFEVPVDTGRLRASGLVSPPIFRGSEVVVKIGYGTTYALPVHERSVRYLEGPLERRTDFAANVGARTMKNIRLGRGSKGITEEKGTAS